MLKTKRERYIRTLYEDYSGVLKSFLVSRYGSEDFANEVSQETFCIACEKKKELSRHPCPEGWLYITAEKKARELNRRRIRIENHEAPLLDTEGAVCQTFSEIETKEVIKEVLTTKDYKMLLLKFDMKYNYREISNIYGISEDACKKRVYRSLFRVRTHMREC